MTAKEAIVHIGKNVHYKKKTYSGFETGIYILCGVQHIAELIHGEVKKSVLVKIKHKDNLAYLWTDIANVEYAADEEEVSAEVTKDSEEKRIRSIQEKTLDALNRCTV